MAANHRKTALERAQTGMFDKPNKTSDYSNLQLSLTKFSADAAFSQLSNAAAVYNMVHVAMAYS